MEKAEIGANIRYFRKLRGFTQEELAKKVGISTMSIRRYESGDRIATIDVIKRIAPALDVGVETLLPKDSLVSLDVAGKHYRAEYAGSWGHYVIDEQLKGIFVQKENWTSDKAARLYMCIDSNLLDILERMAKFDSISLEDEIEKILHLEVEARLEEEYSEEFDQWNTDAVIAAPQDTSLPQDGKDTNPPADAPERPPEGE